MQNITFQLSNLHPLRNRPSSTSCDCANGSSSTGWAGDIRPRTPIWRWTSTTTPLALFA